MGQPGRIKCIFCPRAGSRFTASGGFASQAAAASTARYVRRKRRTKMSGSVPSPIPLCHASQVECQQLVGRLFVCEFQRRVQHPAETARARGNGHLCRHFTTRKGVKCSSVSGVKNHAVRRLGINGFLREPLRTACPILFAEKSAPLFFFPSLLYGEPQCNQSKLTAGELHPTPTEAAQLLHSPGSVLAHPSSGVTLLKTVLV